MLSPLGLPPPCPRPSNRMSSAKSLPHINRMTSKMTSSMDRSSADWPTFDDILHRFRNFPHSIPPPFSTGHSNPKAHMAPLEIPTQQRLGPAFELNPPTPVSSTSRYLNNVHDDSVIDIFAPKMSFPDSSPSSSSSSDYGVGPVTPFTNGSSPSRWSLHEAFAITCSRVILLHVAPPASLSSVFALFSSLDCNPSSVTGGSAPVPISMWTLHGEPRREPEDVWAVFRCHDDACAALFLFHPFISIAPALESDLEPFDKLRPLEVSAMHASSSPALSRGHPQHPLRMSFSTPDLQKRAQAGMPGLIHGSIAAQKDDFVISSNPPNPRTTFRLGDWICNAPNCAAHNFGRNLACRGCGCPRAEYPMPSMQTCVAQATRLPSSPRFVGSAHPAQPYSLPTPNGTASNSRSSSVSQPIMGIAKSPSPTQPLLTPSGRAFSVGGKVQNISSDPYAPCVMYWPDNEPIPEQGQIRPSGLAAVPQPPILNTGNRGPIEHQPGDWICLKCNYLNWRRRKVCQTCYPYAEGNGDSISAAVQAERISLLTSLLTQNQGPSTSVTSNMSASTRAPRSHSMTPPQRHRMFQDMVTKQTPAPYRSRSHIDLGAQYAESQFIYETSGPNKSSSFPSLNDLETHLPNDTSASLLPSFLQDIVQSPTLSPTSTSSADLSIEEYEDSFPSPPRSLYGREHLITSNDSSSNLPIGNNIWRLNGEESKGLSGIALPNHEDLLGGSRRSSREMLRYQVISP